MICEACGHEWVLLLAHVVLTRMEGGEKKELVQCPKCGHLQVVLAVEVGSVPDGGD